MEGGFYQQKSINPKAVAVVVLLHGAVLGALITAKGDVFERFKDKPIIVKLIKEVPPPPDQPIPQPNQKMPQEPTIMDQPKRLIELPLPRAPVDTGPPIPIPLPPLPPGPDFALNSPPPPPIPVHQPVRVDSRIDNASALQPPYPASAQREGAEGTVQVRIAIGPDGRVKSVEKVRASRDDFFSATERQALRYWRFKPATIDGKPIESSKVMTVHFRIDDLG